jgi:uncharacterized protein (DUF1697 family)
MPKYIAFLRAVNVGGHIVKMEALREQFAALGFANVETFIASGNVIFDSKVADAAKLEKKIANHLAEWLGYEVPTMIRSVKELTVIAEYQAYPPNEVEAAGALHVVFLAETPPADTAEKLRAICTDVDDFHLNGRELWWLCRVKFNESKVKPAQFGKALSKISATARNITTVKKLAAKYAAANEKGKKK